MSVFNSSPRSIIVRVLLASAVYVVLEFAFGKDDLNALTTWQFAAVFVPSLILMLFVLHYVQKGNRVFWRWFDEYYSVTTGEGRVLTRGVPVLTAFLIVGIISGYWSNQQDAAHFNVVGLVLLIAVVIALGIFRRRRVRPSIFN